MTRQIHAPAAYVPPMALAFEGQEGARLVSPAQPLPTSEPSYAAAAPITLDVPFAAPRAVAVVAQGPGEILFPFRRCEHDQGAGPGRSLHPALRGDLHSGQRDHRACHVPRPGLRRTTPCLP